MKKKLSIFLTLLVLTFTTSMAYGQQAWFSFSGTVAGAKVNGALTLQYGGRVDGNYQYNKHSNSYLAINGSWYRSGTNTYQLSLTEYSSNGVSGSWNVTFNERTGRLTGTMRNKKGKTYKVNCRCYWD